MVYRSKRAIDSGDVETFILKGDDSSPIMITSYKMWDTYALEHRIPRPLRHISVSIFDANALEWKKIVSEDVFSDRDCMEMQDHGTLNLLKKVKEWFEFFLGIKVSW